MNKPYSESCVQNQDPILEVIRPLLQDQKAVLEIGSGTGQHAVYFAKAMPHLEWHTSDQAMYHVGIQQWLHEAQLPNTHAPLALDVLQPDWPEITVDAVFTANTFHIMSKKMVAACIAGVGELLSSNSHVVTTPRKHESHKADFHSNGLFMVYGPFNYNGEYTSASNAQFDQWLTLQNPASAIRDFEFVDHLAQQAGMVLEGDYAMPANNRILCWRKV